MTYGNDVRDDSQQLRDIQDLIAQLDAVNRKLAQPLRVTSELAVTPDNAGAVGA